MSDTTATEVPSKNNFYNRFSTVNLVSQWRTYYKCFFQLALRVIPWRSASSINCPSTRSYHWSIACTGVGSAGCPDAALDRSNTNTSSTTWWLERTAKNWSWRSERSTHTLSLQVLAAAAEIQL